MRRRRQSVTTALRSGWSSADYKLRTVNYELRTDRLTRKDCGTMTELTVLDVAGFAVIGMVVAVGVLAGYAWQEHEAAARLRVRAEEHAMWTDEFQRERDVAEQRLAVLQRQHQALSELYLHHVRQSVAANTVLIYRNVAARRKS